MSEQRRPIGEVLDGLSIHPLDEGEQPVWAFVLVKVEGSDAAGWSFRTTSPPNHEELLGALEVQVELLKRRLLAEWD